MKTTVLVTALKAFSHNDQSYQLGQRFILSPIDAVVLGRKRLITLTKRKAMMAESAPVPIEEPPAPPVAPREDPKPRPPKPREDKPKPKPTPRMVPAAKRTYQRRDLQAEPAREPEPVHVVPPIPIAIGPSPEESLPDETTTPDLSDQD